MGNDYTVSIARPELQEPAVVTWKDLYAAKLGFNSPFQLHLAGDQLLFVDCVIRLLPKKRLVAFGSWQDKPVIAKLFFDPHHAKRHMEKDAEGVKILRTNKIPTPALYYQGFSKDKRVYVLLFQCIFEAKNLQEIWLNKINIEESLPILRSVVVELATQHVLGVLQQDLHLANFLLTRKTIFTLDGAQIELFPQLLPKKQSMANLALLLSQLGVGMEVYQEKLFRHYAKSRGWLLKPQDISELFLQIKKWNNQRWLQFDKKIFRDCTDFVSIRRWKTVGMYDRRYAFPELMACVQDPEAAFLSPGIQVLKAGGSSTVIKIRLDNRDYVIKRYNIKNSWHQLRRAFRPSRAMKSWRFAQKLKLFGVQTAHPVAFVEKRYLGLRTQSYYVTEYVSDEHAGQYFIHHRQDENKTFHMMKAISHLFKNLAQLEITHGDLKITNILIDAKDQPVLIDLDGATEHLSLSSLRTAWIKEVKRFFKNFREMPELLEKFKTELLNP